MDIRYKILVIEDEETTRLLIQNLLDANGYESIFASKGRDGESLMSSHCPDLVLLDLGLPDIDGMDVLKSLRTWATTPVIVVSACGEEMDKVAALENGADDYIHKPFGAAELLARIKVALRHSNTVPSKNTADEYSFKVGELVVDFRKLRVYVGDRDACLTQNEYRIVALLARNAGKVLTYNYIIQQLWGPNGKSDNQILRVHMANIRRKIDDSPAKPRYLLTETGVGYRMADE